MSTLVRVLIIDDSEDDALLLVRHLRSSGFDVSSRREENRDGLRAALEEERWDLIICDYSMPQLSVPMALKLVRQHDADIPVIVVSGFVGEDELIQLVKIGAQDIILKHNLARLKPAIERGLAEAELRREKKRTDAQLISAIESIGEGIALYDPEDRLVVCNRRYKQFYGPSQALIIPGMKFEEIMRDAVRRGQFALGDRNPEEFVSDRVAARSRPVTPEEFQLANERWVKAQACPTPDGGKVSVLTDITNRKRREEQLHVQARELSSANVKLSREIRLRKRVEESLRESELRARAIFDGAGDGVIIFDGAGIIESVNPAAERIFGRLAKEIVGQRITDHMPDQRIGLHLDAAARSAEAIGSANGSLHELELLRRDGAIVPIEWTVSEVQVNGNRIYTAIVRDITERRRIDQMKSEFISVVGHELRTPLTSIKGSLGLLRSEAPGPLPGKAMKMVDIAHRNCERLVRLINDIIDTEKIETGRMQFQIRPVRLKAVLEQAIETNRIFAEQFGVDICLENGATDGMILADRDRLIQVMTNLLSNAVKFSSAGTRVSINATQMQDMLRVSVSDQGPGISKAFRDRVFEKFSQADASDTRDKGGSGLGLSIARAIVERHGGTIGFDTVEGRGTTFFFDLPVHRDRPEAGDHHAPAGMPKVLVCDDDEAVRALLEREIRRMGYEVEACTAADEARTRLDAGDISVLVVDLALPDHEGIRLVRELRERPEQRDLSIVAISAQADRRRKGLAGRALNLVDWLDKPADPQRLRAAVERAVENCERARPLVLHMEDDGEHAGAVSRIVGDLVELAPARTPEEAGKLLGRAKFDLVILDIVLPGAGGECLLPLICETSADLPPVLLLSAPEFPHPVLDRIAQSLNGARVDHERFRRQVEGMLGASWLRRDIWLMERKELCQSS